MHVFDRPLFFILLATACLMHGGCGHEVRTVDLSEAIVRHEQLLPEALTAAEVAFNPAIAQVQNEYLMAFRVDGPTQDGNGPCQQLAVVALDAHFKPRGPHVILQTPHEPGMPPSAEDPRLVVVQDVPYLIYNAAVVTGPWPGRRMFVARLRATRTPEGPTYALDVAKEIWLALPHFGRRIEKNWTPFVYGDALHLIYQTNPHSVFRLDLNSLDDTGPYALAQPAGQNSKKVDFSFGPMRGGTQALFAPELDQYISFFHGSKRVDLGSGKRRYYMMGAYTFDKEPPFAIRSLTRDPIMIPEPDAGPIGQTRVVFPAGLVDDGDHYVVSYGREDKTMFMLTLDKAQVLAVLEPVR
jgi:predicted GH43/DUF377 family glycosyl hydrolase